MYYGVEDFLEKTAKTRLAKEFVKTIDDIDKLEGLPWTFRDKVVSRAWEKARQLDPASGNLAPYRVYDIVKGNSKYRGNWRGYRRFKPATEDEIMNTLQGEGLRKRTTLNKLPKADRDLIKKYL